MSRTLLVFLIVAGIFNFRAGLAAASPPVKGDAESNPGSEWADVSDTLGFPLGGLGTGYCAFGRYGFVHVNFDGRPRDSGHGLDAGEWEYTAADAKANGQANLKKVQSRMRGKKRGHY